MHRNVKMVYINHWLDRRQSCILISKSILQRTLFLRKVCMVHLSIFYTWYYSMQINHSNSFCSTLWVTDLRLLCLKDVETHKIAYNSFNSNLKETLSKSVAVMIIHFTVGLIFLRCSAKN